MFGFGSYVCGAALVRLKSRGKLLPMRRQGNPRLIELNRIYCFWVAVNMDDGTARATRQSQKAFSERNTVAYL